MDASHKLDNRAERFAREYLVDLNATRAAIAAGYSKRTAYAAASRLLKSAKVKSLLAELSKNKMEQLDVSADRILLELSRIAFRDVRKLFDNKGDLRPIQELDDATAAAIAGVDHDDLFQYFGKGQRKKIGTTTKVRMADKTKALELLGKYRTLFTEKVEHVFPEQPFDPSKLSDADLETVERIIGSAYIGDEGLENGAERKG